MAVKQTAGRDALGEFAPKFAELNDDVLFGQVWNREDKLSLRDRSLVTVVSLMSQGLVDSSFQYHLITAKQNGITRQEIAEFPLILLERKASSRVFLEQYFLQSGITLTPEIELSSRSLLVSLARIGLGVAGVTLEFVQDALLSGDIRLLKTDFTIPSRSVDMCTLRDVTPTAAAAAFMEMVRREAR